MKNEKQLPIVISLAIGLFWFLAITCFFILPDNAREKEYQDVIVKLKEPIFAVSGIDDEQLALIRIDDEHVVKYENGEIFLDSRYRAYVNLDRTELIVMSDSDGTHLSRSDMISLFSNVSDGTIKLEEIGVFPSDFPITRIGVDGEDKDTFLLPREFSIQTNGKYSGHIAFRSYIPSIEENKTDIARAHQDKKHVPINSLIMALFYSGFIAIAFYLVSRRMKHLKLVTLCFSLLSVLVIVLFSLILC